MIGATHMPRFSGKPLFDMSLGFALMGDRRVRLRHKALAIFLGLAITGIVEFLEIPVEGVMTMLIPILGVLGDAVVDGAEIVAGPILLAAVLLPFLAPHDLVEKIRSERSATPGASRRAGKGPIIDV
jgi:hypothetical protein